MAKLGLATFQPDFLLEIQKKCHYTNKYLEHLKPKNL